MIDEFKGPYWALSNFSRYACWMGGDKYPTVEHGFQAAKTLDRVKRKEIRLATGPAIAKRMGRNVELRAGWNMVRTTLMLQLLTTKFHTTSAGEVLLGTGDAPLVEGNTWHDQFWGDCRCGRPSCEAPGRNVLGRSLEIVREQLRD